MQFRPLRGPHLPATAGGGGPGRAARERKGRSWYFSSKIYERLREKAAYVRQRGFEPIRQEQMVLQYVQAHDRITRREAVELCQLGPQQATRLWRKLVSEGRIQRQGEGKGELAFDWRAQIGSQS